MGIIAATVFLSSFLLFLVQPMLAKFLLPAFGGTAAVWATCLVVFQSLLLAGYAYAHLSRTMLSARAQRWTHLGLLALALCFLPPAPAAHLPAGAAAAPLPALLRCLLVTIGVPFFALSATAPLLMEWFRQSHPGRTPDRLYAFSNAGSLLALIAYPTALEPALSRGGQAQLWAGAVVLFLVVCAVAAWRTKGQSTEAERAPVALKPEGGNEARHRTLESRIRISSPVWLWIALPACGSALLLALTNQLSQDVAPMPLLWVVPMTLYLLSFILCFEGPRCYQRLLFMPACFVCFLLLAWMLNEGYLHGFWFQLGGYLLVLFLGCMVCHGELYRLRPNAERLTAYYLALALGGALGGVFVALVAPLAFDSLLETPFVAVAVPALCAFILWRERRAQNLSPRTARDRVALRPEALALAGTVFIAIGFGWVMHEQRKQSIYFTRSFYGACRVKQGPTLLLDKIEWPLTPGVARVLLSGQIYHGLQFLEPQAAKVPTTYYCEEGGLGLAFRELPAATNRNIGAIGLGAGTLAAYGRPGDNIRFYELNPDVARIARAYFAFLTNSQARVEVVLGDGRLSLEGEPDQRFDLLVLDAFAGDSIPMHLLTEQAMRTYQRHLKPEGVMAFHISNSHLDLEPVVRALAHNYGLNAVLVPPKLLDPRLGKLASVWMLVSANKQFFERPAVAELMRATGSQRNPLLWTDDRSSILPILH